MQSWKTTRDVRDHAEFESDLLSLAVDRQALDEVLWAGFERVLCGASTEAIDDIYPIVEDTKVRVFETFRVDDVPALFIAFAVEPDGTICRLGCKLAS